MHNNEPINHHYIPQFILRAFCDKDEKLRYRDVKKKTEERKFTNEIFVVRNLYRDDINNSDVPMQIEKDLAKFEGEAAYIIKRFQTGDVVEITLEEVQKLKLFFAIMGFRAKRVRDSYTKDVGEDFDEVFGKYQPDGDYGDYWKRNLGALVNCRSINEVMKHPKIDEPVKLFMWRDTEIFDGSFYTIVERRGKENFILSDAYPTVIVGSSDNGLELPMYSVFPISPTRAIILFAKEVNNVRQSVRMLDGKYFRIPKLGTDGKTIRLSVKKVYEDDIRLLNKLAEENATDGIVLS